MKWASETFGRRLAAIRTDGRLTQAQLGVAVGKSRRTISDWKNSLFVRDMARRRGPVRPRTAVPRQGRAGATR